MSILKSFQNVIGVVVVSALASTVHAASHDQDDEEIPFDEAFIFFELNNTDGDLGIHAKIDGDEWKRLTIEDPRERRMLKINVQGRLRRQGLTELFFESAEPRFADLAPSDFFKRFPEGTYEVEGITLDGEEMESETRITHLLPAPPQPSINGVPFDTDCDDDETPTYAADDLVISWPPVVTSHPDLGRTGQPVEIVNYEVVVEIPDTLWRVNTILPPSVTAFEIPEEILELAEDHDGEVKYEILARESSHNQTAIESCFALESEE